MHKRQDNSKRHLVALHMYNESDFIWTETPNFLSGTASAVCSRLNKSSIKRMNKNKYQPLLLNLVGR